MFGKKTANGYSEEKDLQLLMQAMDGVIAVIMKILIQAHFRIRHMEKSLMN